MDAIDKTRTSIEGMFREGIEFRHMVERLRSEIIEASGKSEDSIPEFLSEIYLREMLKTGLMGFFAFMLEYAPYPRGFSFDECEVNHETCNHSVPVNAAS
ncbi:MAG TPA: hypothetical protein ENH50_04860 [Nitrospirae bacterium]|nr:hypothetical protein [Nitrospirota bacterium]